VWDYIFGTAYMPKDGRDIELGFEEVEKYPHSFLEQQCLPFREQVKSQVKQEQQELENTVSTSSSAK